MINSQENYWLVASCQLEAYQLKSGVRKTLIKMIEGGLSKKNVILLESLTIWLVILIRKIVWLLPTFSRIAANFLIYLALEKDASQ